MCILVTGLKWRPQPGTQNKQRASVRLYWLSLPSIACWPPKYPVSVSEQSTNSTKVFDALPSNIANHLKLEQKLYSYCSKDEGAIKFNHLSRTANSKVQVVPINHVILAYIPEITFPHIDKTQITINLKKLKKNKKVRAPIKLIYHWRWQLYLSLQLLIYLASSLDWNKFTYCKKKHSESTNLCHA